MIEGMHRSEDDWKKQMETLRQESEKIDIERLEAPLTEILSRLRPELKRGTYKVILGDDASGRLPALILSKVIANIYAEYGHAKPLTRFVAGSRRYRYEEERDVMRADMEAHMGRIGNDAGIDSAEPEEDISQIAKWFQKLLPDSKEQKVLIVTDTIHTGLPTGFLVESLAANGIHADVATIGLFDTTENEASRNVGARVIGGSDDAASVYGKSGLSGVDSKAEQLFARPTVRLMNATQAAKIQDSVNRARAVANDVAQRMTSAYFSREGLKKAA